ncbi:protein of unknown function [Pustulibacterium marinum]|uniref:DUF4249 domain-containing protein n=1 Tax=Pustulibacterium marinum TaxID=1224947 RepID=A0A1I7EVY4_9FLAO|nr:DUF4249 domain-containing protein [Pustulibacterium marinum]SFU28045.1 protein of unknown function [Pustulibacterium marinum]
MKLNLYKIISAFIIIMVAVGSCTEPYNAISESYESLLVVEATITDSIQQHTVLLSRTNAVNSYDRNVESGAEVWVESSTGETFQFSESDEEGTYLSNTEFAAQQGNTYTLHITTSNGRKYVSSEEETPQKTEITNVYPEVATNDIGVEGVKVFADVSGTDGSPVFVKYEYTEQYKIVTLVDVPYDYTLENLVRDTNYEDGTCETDFDLVFTDRTENSSICYSFPTVSNTIIQNNSASYSGTEIPYTEVNFIAKDEYKLRERYSILVRAYSQSYDSYQYYNLVHKMNENDSELSSQQPGYIKGNIHSDEDEDERVFGFFNVWSLSQKRIFFDYTDFGFPQPDYFAELISVEISKGETPCPGPTNNDSIVILRGRNYQLNGLLPGAIGIPGGYKFVNPACSDCRSRGDNVPPDYWEEE